ncbi:MAG: CoA transferase [Bacteroidetes bacterium]|nr:CoA transferase [Bacteroidota bacterium]
MFKDLKIIELSSVLAGPAVGMFFSELGAKVIKVENPLTGGDVTRSWKLPSEYKDAPVSAYYSSVNWNKEIVFIDISTAIGKQEVYNLSKDADIIIVNYKAGAAEKLQMDYESFKTLNPKVIYASITGFPEGNNRPAFDVVLQAETGFMSMNGTAESGPVKMPVAIIDILAAHQLKEAILIALIQKAKTGEGSHVSTSLYESAIASLANQASNYLMAGHIAKPIGSLHPNIAPYGETFKTRDEKLIILAIGNDKQFLQLCNLLGIETNDIELYFSTNKERVKNRGLLFEKLAPKIVLYNGKDFMQELDEFQIPGGIVKNMEEVFSSDSTKKLVLEEIIQNTTTKRVKTVAFKTSF